MFDDPGERVREFLRQRADDAIPLIADYYAADPRARDHPTQIVVHPSGAVQVLQADAVMMVAQPSVAVLVKPSSTADEIQRALIIEWLRKPEMSDYPLVDD
jgi:hypothetical protein